MGGVGEVLCFSFGVVGEVLDVVDNALVAVGSIRGVVVGLRVGSVMVTVGSVGVVLSVSFVVVLMVSSGSVGVV